MGHAWRGKRGTRLAISAASVTFETWCAVIGALLLGVALSRNLLKNWPITTAAIYLGLGLILGPLVFNVLHFEPLKHTEVLERVTEIAVIISLFSAGLKLRLPLHDKRWRSPLRLALISMTITVGLIALIGTQLLGLSLGAAVLLGAFLAPTDPVLASDVQTRHPDDYDELRFSLTGEAGFNDGTAFPFVMLGLGLLGLHELGEWGWRWLAIDVIWAIFGGLGIGALLGHLTALLVLYLRQSKHQAVGTDDFLALGLIAGSYGLAILLTTYGFLAVFAAGLALRHTERRISERQNEDEPPNDNEMEKAEQDEEDAQDETEPRIPEGDQDVEELEEKLATDEKRAPRFMARQMMHFNESLERIGELLLVVWLGGMIVAKTWDLRAMWLALLIFLVVRPVSVFIGLLGDKLTGMSRPYIAWFGLRGIGSLYYLFYAIEHDLDKKLAGELIALVFPVIAISIVLHGITVSPLAKRYEKAHESEAEAVSESNRPLNTL